MACECLYIEWIGNNPGSGEFNPSGDYNGQNFWTITIEGTPYYIFWGGVEWTFSDGLGNPPILVNIGGENSCPCLSDWTTPPETPIFSYEIITAECGSQNCCLIVSLIDDNGSFLFELNFQTRLGIFNCFPWWGITTGGTNYFTIYNAGESESGGCIWRVNLSKPETGPNSGKELFEFITRPCGCPISQNWTDLQTPEQTIVSYFATGSCSEGCIPLQERIFREYDSIKLPEIFEEEDRGFFKCCCPFMVLASDTTDTWKNDVSSGWVKLSDPGDTFSFILKKGGVITNYIPIANPFVKEENAYYCTILWKDVLASDGPGCYTLEISQNIAGIELNYTWGTYFLKPYSIENALKTARIRVIFNSFQEIEGINFAGSQVEETFRFYGFIGNRQPNTEIDNIIYQNREVKKVLRENLNEYEILTDPICEEFTKRLTDLYLLSENKLFISDYNAFNHSYRIQDIPVIVEESPEITYYDFSREASVKCVVGDKFKNKRSYYGGN